MVAGTQGSLNKAGSTKMTQNSGTAGIDTSKAKLDVAVHGGAERWQVANSLPGRRQLAAAFAKIEIGPDRHRGERRLRAWRSWLPAGQRLYRPGAAADPSQSLCPAPFASGQECQARRGA